MGKIVEQKAGGGGGRIYVERCGNGKCGKGETAENCPQDCKRVEEAEKEAEEVAKGGEGAEKVEEVSKEQEPSVPTYPHYVPYIIGGTIVVVVGAVVWYLLYLKRMHYLGYK